jgi:predicted dehydrogenase
MRIAIVGCGFVADQYMLTLPSHPELELVGVLDRDRDRAAKFSSFYKVRAYDSLQGLCDDPQVELVLNLTNPRSHYEVSEACLRAGKHVYSEKPLAMSFEDARALVKLAAEKQVQLSCAPSRLLGDTAQTMWKALRSGTIGKVRLVYAEMDDGMLHKQRYRTWAGASGAPWPYKDELEIGCTIEHAGYSLTWLLAYFGPADSVTAFSSVLIPDKETDVAIDQHAPDFSVGIIRFRSGIVGRLTCSIVAPHDHAIRIFGDEGELSTDDCWKPRSPVRLKKRVSLMGRSAQLPWRKSVPMLGDAELRRRTPKGLKKVDFCLGPLEMANAVRERRTCRLTPDFVLHVNEVTLAISNAMENSATVKLQSSFEPLEPMPWAR